MKSEKKYRLYIGQPTVKLRTKYQFYSVTSGYQLAYSDKPIEGMSVVPLEKEKRITAQERDWLRRCKVEINIAAIKAQEKQYAEALNQMLDLIEKDLQSEAEKVKNEKVRNAKQSDGKRHK